MPDSPAEQAVAAYFHHMRGAGKKKDSPGVDRIVQAIKERAMSEEQDLEKLTDAELIKLYNTLEPEDERMDPVLNEIEKRNLDL